MGAQVRVGMNRRKLETIWRYPGGEEDLVNGSYRPDDHLPFSGDEIRDAEEQAQYTKTGPQECSSHDAPKDAPFGIGEWVKCRNYGAYHLLTASDGMREYMCERHAQEAVEGDDRIAIRVSAVRELFNFVRDIVTADIGSPLAHDVNEIKVQAELILEQMKFPPVHAEEIKQGGKR